LVTVPAYFIAWALWLATAPLGLAIAAAVDLLRRPRVALRSWALVAAYLSCEIVGIAASAALWIWREAIGIEDERWDDLHFRLEAWWGATLFASVVRLFELRIEVESDSSLADGPYILLVRHTSAGDTLLASALVSRPLGMRLRYVLKQELLWDPCLDIVGRRLPNVFIDRSSRDSESEVRQVRRLGEELGPREGVLIYPEGTRFSKAKRARVLARLKERANTRMLEYAETLDSVLPPRTGGTLALLEASPAADVIVCAHTGFEGAGSLLRIWRGDLLRRTVQIRFRRVPRSGIPKLREEQISWLLTEWQRVSDWVSLHQPDLQKEDSAR
jgi:1-acyl-sn-glycerol-3-phosphate acyltransferase